MIKRYYVHFFLVVLTISILFFNYNRELIPINAGYGWDGQAYAEFTQNFDSLIRQKGINNYYFQRILPPLIINKSLRFLNVDFTPANIINAYRVLDFIMICLAMVYYFLFSKLLGFSKKILVVGFVSLFWSFPILKLSFYYPLLSDVPAFSLGLVIFYHHLRNHIVAQFILIFLSSFVFPTFILFSCLLLFKKGKIVKQDASYLNLKKALFPIAYLIIILGLFFLNSNFLNITISGTNPINKALLLFSFLIVIIYLFIVAAPLAKIFSIKKFFLGLSIKYTFIVSLMVCLLQILKYHFASLGKAFGPIDYVSNIVKQSVTNPATFLVAHVTYFGVIFILIAFFWHQFVDVIIRMGYGVTCLVSICLFLAIGSESRQLINLYPIVLIIGLVMLKSIKILSNVLVAFYAIFCLSISRFWQLVNLGDTKEIYFIKYPHQAYFKFQGPWMSNHTFFFNVIILLILIAIFYILIKYNIFFRKAELNKR